MAKRDSLAKNTLLLSLGTFMTKGLSFVMVPLFSRWLSTEDYGTFDLLCTYVSLLIPLIGLASNEAVFRFSVDAESKREKARYITNDLFLFAFNTGITFVILSVAYWVFHWKLAYYFFFLLVGELFSIYMRGFLRGIKKLQIYAFSHVINTLVTAIATTILIKGMGLGLEGIIVGYGIGYIAGDIILAAMSKYWEYFAPKTFSLKTIRDMVAYSFPLIPNNLAWWVINVSDRTIINIVIGTAANGIYAIAYKIPNICSALFSVFGVSWQQSATEMLDSKERDQYYNEVYNKMTAVLISLCCGILSMNAWLFNYIFDIRYYEAHRFVPILVAGTLFTSVALYFGGIQISLRMPKENGITTVAGAATNVIVHLVLIHFIGLYAAAVSTLASQVVVCILRKIRLKKHVIVRLDRKTKLLAVVYLYFTAMAYMIDFIVMNVLNVGLASLLVLWVNREYFEKALRRLKKICG